MSDLDDILGRVIVLEMLVKGSAGALEACKGANIELIRHLMDNVEWEVCDSSQHSRHCTQRWGLGSDSRSPRSG